MGKNNKNVGKIAFLIAIFGSLLLGLLGALGVFTAGVWMTVILVVAGIVTGLMHIPKDKAIMFMVIALVLGLGSAGLSALPLVGEVIGAMLSALASVMIPAGIVVALKSLIAMK